MIKIGLHYSNSGDRLVEVKRKNPDNTYATVFHTKLRTMWVPARSDYCMTETEIVDFLADGPEVAGWENVHT
jgi:hypothetical protein